MKRIVFLFTTVLALSVPAGAQVQLKGLTTFYSGSPTRDTPVLAIGYYGSGAEFGFNEMGTDVAGIIDLSNGRNLSRVTAGESYDSAGVHLFFTAGTPVEGNGFEYRLMDGQGKLVKDWSAAGSTVIERRGGNLNYLGSFQQQQGTHLIADLRRKGTATILSTAVVFFRKIQPELLDIYLGSELKDFVRKIAGSGWRNDSVHQRRWKASGHGDLDSTTGLPRKLRLNPSQNDLIFYLKGRITRADQLEYQLWRDGKVITGWKANDFDNSFIWLNDLSPGSYELKIRFPVQKEHVTTYPFEVGRRWDQTLSFKILGGGLIAAFFGFLLLLFRLRWQRQRLERAKAQRDKAQADLRSLYAQLNPHFIFNALNSIQGLVNKGDPESASQYLSTFSRLLRDTLVNAEKEAVPLATEIGMLQTYLQLEQLRFHFHYRVEVDEQLSTAEVEIPALLLQPLVENAIRHGAGSRKNQGSIRVAFSREGADLVVHIEDNGSGFDPLAPVKEYGMKLTRQRIRLLTESDRERPVSMAVDAGKGRGTHIRIQFRNWL